MKRNLFLCLTAAVVLSVFAGCGEKKQKEHQTMPTTEPAEERNEWEEKIMTELFSGETVLEQAMAEAVVFQVEEKGEDTLEVTITAPDISEELILWMESVSDEAYSDKALEEEMLRLLAETEPEETKVTVEYQTIDGERILDYSREFTNGITCGLVEFYMETTRQMIEEMKEAES